MRNIFNERWEVGIVLPFGHAFSGEPGNGIASSVMVFECSFEPHDEVGEGPHGYGGPRDGILPKGGCPSEGRSFGHVG